MSVVIVPAYKPDGKLIEIAEELWRHGCCIIVVDDGSGKEYQPFFEEVKDVCTVLHHPKNQGKGAAIKTALAFILREYPNADCIGVMDCDGQHTVRDMIKLLCHARLYSETLVLGVRQIGKKMPFRSRFGNTVTRFIFRLISGVRVSDTQSGLRAFSPTLINTLLVVRGERYEYETNVLFACAREKIPMLEIPVETIYHDRKNFCSHFRVLRDSVRIYKDILKFAMSSLSSFILDYLLFALLMLLLPHTAIPVLLANVGARVVSAAYNYCMNCRFVFHQKKKLRTALDYLALAGLVLLANNVILETLVQIVRAPVYSAKLLTECILFVVSFLVQDRLIFPKSYRKRGVNV